MFLFAKICSIVINDLFTLGCGVVGKICFPKLHRIVFFNAYNLHRVLLLFIVSGAESTWPRVTPSPTGPMAKLTTKDRYI